MPHPVASLGVTLLRSSMGREPLATTLPPFIRRDFLRHNGPVPPTLLFRLLVVAEPWASLLVNGQKTWELRTTATKVRGLIGIAAKGTGAIIGAVNLVGVHGPMTAQEATRFKARHRVDADQVAKYGGAKGLYAWEVEGARRMEPIPYSHPQGAVIWVLLDPPVKVPTPVLPTRAL